MLKALIKKQLQEQLSAYAGGGKDGNARTKRGIPRRLYVVIGLFVFLCFAFYTTAYEVGSLLLGRPDAAWLYFALMGMIAGALGVFGSAFSTYAMLYLPKDNEMMLSLPIPPSYLLISRMTGVYIASLFYSACVWIPTLVAFWNIVPPTALTIAFPVLLAFVLALFVMVVSSIVGWIVALVAVRTKGKSYINVILTLVLLGAYFAVYFWVMNSFSDMMLIIGSMSDSLQTWLYPVYAFGMAASGDALSMLIITLLTLAAAALCVFVLSRTFMKATIKESSGRRNVRKARKAEGFTQISQQKALLKREMKFFTSISTWMINGGLGLVVMVILAVLSIVNAADIREAFALFEDEVPFFADLMPMIVFMVVGFMTVMNVISTAAISLEGNRLWVLQTLPVSSWDVLRAIERLDIEICAIPVVLASVAFGVSLQLSAVEIVLVTCAVLILLVLKADFGMMLDLRHPNLTWTNQAVPVKRSFSVLVQMIGGWVVCIVVGALGSFASSIVGPIVPLACIIVLLGAAAFLTRRWLKTKGAAIFATLS